MTLKSVKKILDRRPYDDYIEDPAVIMRAAEIWNREAAQKLKSFNQPQLWESAIYDIERTMQMYTKDLWAGLALLMQTHRLKHLPTDSGLRAKFGITAATSAWHNLMAQQDPFNK